MKITMNAILVLGVLASQSLFAGVRFDSEFRGIIPKAVSTERTSRVFIKSAENDPYTWIISQVDDCETFPCSPADHTTILGSFSPELISNQMQLDGPLIIGLGSDIRLIQDSGFSSNRKQSPYTLAITIAGKAHKIELHRLNTFTFN